MTQRHFVTRWLALGLTFSLVGGVVSQGTANAQTLAETQQSADQGDAAAQFNLGIRYATGEGVAQDYVEAVAWMRKAADQGDAGAQYNLAVSYVNGLGVPQDFTQAVAWYRKAADQGYADAQYNLGSMYSRGAGLPQDYVEAHKWRNLAASRVTGDEQKRYAEPRDALAKLITPAQLAEAQRLAREWQAAFEERQAE